MACFEKSFFSGVEGKDDCLTDAITDTSYWSLEGAVESVAQPPCGSRARALRLFMSSITLPIELSGRRPN
jgi:hypothetical protein